MNVIQIQKLINKIGEFNISFNEQKKEYFLNDENIINMELSSIEVIRAEYQQKLSIQLKQKSDVKLLTGFLQEAVNNIIALEGFYHNFRIKVSECKPSNTELNKALKKICKIIDVKIYNLEEIKADLEYKIKYFDYKLITDFGEIETQIMKESELEEDELNLSGLPNLNIAERFKLLKLLKIVEVLENLELDRKSKFKLLALTMGISLVNARHLLSDSYKFTSKSENKSLENFLAKENISI